MTDDELTAIYGKDRKHPRFAEVKDTYEYSGKLIFQGMFNK